jgi:hypothetical protein
MNKTVEYRVQDSTDQTISRPTTEAAAPDVQTNRPSHQSYWSDFIAWIRALDRQAAAFGFVAGLIIGLPILGWWLWPVVWVNAGFQDLEPSRQTILVETMADLSAYSPATNRITQIIHGWEDADQIACNLASQETDQSERIRLLALAYRINGVGCYEQ